MKTLTSKQLESRKDKAVRFLRDVVQDDERADEVEDESLEDYAERRQIKLQNPAGKGQFDMSVDKTKTDLKRRIRELEQENDDLQTKLDDIADLAMPPEEDEEEEDNAEGEGDEYAD